MLKIVATGEIATYEQFLFLQQYFQKSSAAEASESVGLCKKVKRKTINKSIIHPYVHMSHIGVKIIDVFKKSVPDVMYVING